MLKVWISVASIVLSVGYILYRKLNKKQVIVETVWVIGASSGIGKCMYSLMI